MMIQEMKTVFRELNIYVNEEDINRIMNQFDENGNECIEFQEFIKVLSKNIESSAQQAWLFQAFEIIDQDCDGYLSSQELEKVVKLFSLGIDSKDIKLIMDSCENKEKGISYR